MIQLQTIIPVPIPYDSHSTPTLNISFSEFLSVLIALNLLWAVISIVIFYFFLRWKISLENTLCEVVEMIVESNALFYIFTLLVIVVNFLTIVGIVAWEIYLLIQKL
jgi:hypothetical protein